MLIKKTPLTNRTQMNVNLIYEDDLSHNVKKWERALFACFECWADPEDEAKAVKQVQKRAADFKSQHPEAIGGNVEAGLAFNGQVLVTAIFENPANY